MVDCVKTDRLIPSNTFKLSLEDHRKCDPETNVLSYMPAATSNELRRSSNGSRGKRKLGFGGEEWFCIDCISLMVFCYGYSGSHNTLPSDHERFLPLFMLANWIIAEKRTLPEFPRLFRLHNAFKYALELWKAVKMYDQVMFDGLEVFASYGVPYVDCEEEKLDTQ